VATTNHLKNGMTPHLDGQLRNVVDLQPLFIKADTRTGEYAGRA
jgi:hypothetical protein